MTHLSLSEFRRIKAMSKAKKSRRAEKVAENADLKGSGTSEGYAIGMPKRAKKAKKPKSSRKRLVAKLDALFSMFVRLRGKKQTGGLCELCAKRPIEVCFHWVSRGDYATRWDPNNAVASCRGCNFEETFRKRKYRDMHIMLIGEAAREALEEKARSLTHFTDADLEAILADLTNRMRLL